MTDEFVDRINTVTKATDEASVEAILSTSQKISGLAMTLAGESDHMADAILHVMEDMVAKTKRALDEHRKNQRDEMVKFSAVMAEKLGDLATLTSAYIDHGRGLSELARSNGISPIDKDGPEGTTRDEREWKTRATQVVKPPSYEAMRDVVYDTDTDAREARARLREMTRQERLPRDTGE